MRIKPDICLGGGGKAGFAKALMLAFLSGIILSTFIACSNGSSDSSGGKSVYYAASDLSDYTKRTLASFPTVKSSGSGVPDIFVLKGSQAKSLSDADVNLLVKTVIAGKTVLIDQPVNEILQFTTAMNNLLAINKAFAYELEKDTYGFENLLKDLKKAADAGKANSYQVIAVKGPQVYYVHDINDTVAITKSTSEKSGEKEVSYQQAGADSNPEENAKDNADYKVPTADANAIKASSIASFAKWLSTDSSRSLDRAAFDQVNASPSARIALEEVKKAQSFYHNFTAVYNHNVIEHYDGRYNGRAENVEVITDVWVACELDKNPPQEYYLVRNSVVCNNQDLNWTDDWDHGYYKSPYFSDCYVTTFVKNSNIKRRDNDCSPHNEGGSTNYTTGVSVNLSGNIGGSMSGPQASLGGGITWSESTSRSIPDIMVHWGPYRADAKGNSGTDFEAAHWKYTTKELEGDVNGSSSAILFDNPKEIQTVQAIFDTYALFYGDCNLSDSNTEVAVFTHAAVNLCMSTAWKSGKKFWSLKCNWNNLTACTNANFDNIVVKPVNTKRNYIMGFERPEGVTAEQADRLYAIVKEYISDWNNETDYYAVGTANLDVVAKKRFDAAMTTVETNSNVFKDRGFSGTFKFYIQNTENGEKVGTKEFTF